MRVDRYQFSVTSNNSLNSGNGSDGLLSPKVGAIVGPWNGTELYVNAGTGFHSNDARGAAITVDPVSGEPVDRVTPLVRAKGAEIGLRTVRIRGLQSTVALWYLGIDSELLFVGDAGTTEAGRPSRRVGIEWTNYARLAPWITADADLAFTRARFTDDDPAGTQIPGALDRVMSAGVTVEPKKPVFGSLRVRHFGPRPLIEDGSVTSTSTTIWNGEVGYRLSNTARLVLEVFNIFDAEVSDIDYFYASRLAGRAGRRSGRHPHASGSPAIRTRRYPILVLRICDHGARSVSPNLGARFLAPLRAIPRRGQVSTHARRSRQWNYSTRRGRHMVTLLLSTPQVECPEHGGSRTGGTCNEGGHYEVRTDTDSLGDRSCRGVGLRP